MSTITVIKIGGVASQQLSKDVLEQMKIWKKQGQQLVIVHGGGVAINQLMEEAKVPVQKINGLRVTSQSDMTLVCSALLDNVGKYLTDQLEQAQLNPIQLTDQLRDVVQATFLDKDTYGYVGQVSHIETSPLMKSLEQDKLPLLASLGYSEKGEVLNINADYLATAVAQALQADRLILMTDVKGVLENGQVLKELVTSHVQEKIEQSVITGGMIPKIESAVQTVHSGVGQVLIGDNLLTGTVIRKG